VKVRDKYGRYEAAEEIGDGAMGRVYRGFDPLVRRTVAIKTVKSEYLTRDNADSYLKRFRREVQAAGSLSHASIVSIFDVGEDYFVMEFVEGVTLAALLKERGSVALPEALAILGPVAEALDHAHDSGIIHRDIKPANIMVQPDGRPKLMDFGVARLESSAMTATGQFLGSPSYMAPEQISGGEVSRQSDLFSLAVVAYEAITGQKPFQGDSITSVIYRVMTEAPPPPRQWNFELPPRYDDVFCRALSKNPAERYATASEFVQALDLKEFEIGFPGEDVPPPTVEMSVERGPTAVPAAKSAADPGTEPFEVAPPPTPSARALAVAPKPAATRHSPLAWLVAAAVVLVAIGAVAVARRPVAHPSSPAGPPAPLRIETDPPGAHVVVDGSEVGTSPLALDKLGSGGHQVRVILEGYAPAELNVEVVPGTSLAPLRFVLQSVIARLSVRSEPDGATLRVDGRASGTTPVAKLELAAGRHELRVDQKGFRPWLQQVELRAGENPVVVARLDALLRPEKAPAPATGSAPASPPAPVPTLTPAPVPAEGTLVEMGPDVTQPRKTSGESVRYPELARKLRIFGSVRVEFIVDEKGQPTDVRVSESAGEVLDEAVVDAVRGWRYAPAQKQGVKVKVRWHFRQTFQSGQ
jgi:serine/threonine-protein kinase